MTRHENGMVLRYGPDRDEDEYGLPTYLPHDLDEIEEFGYRAGGGKPEHHR